MKLKKRTKKKTLAISFEETKPTGPFSFKVFDCIWPRKIRTDLLNKLLMVMISTETRSDFSNF